MPVTSKYPAAFDDLPANKRTKTSAETGAPTEGEEGDHSGHHNALAAQGNKTQEVLGLNPQGTRDSVADRLDVMDGAIEAGLGESPENLATRPELDSKTLEAEDTRRDADIMNAQAASAWARLSSVLYGEPTGVYINASFPTANRVSSALHSEAKKGAETIELDGHITINAHYKIGAETVFLTGISGGPDGSPWFYTLAAPLTATHASGTAITTTDLDYTLYRGIGGGRYCYHTFPWLTNNPPAYTYGLNQLHNSGTALPMLSKSRKDASFTRTGTWVNNEREDSFGGGYYESVTPGDKLKWTSPAGTTAIGWRGPTSFNGGPSICVVDGDRTMANLLPTAGELVAEGAYPNTLLKEHGGLADPTDRILNCYANAADFDTLIGLASGLEAGVHTVELIVTGVIASTEIAIEGRTYYSGMAGTDGTTTPATAEAAMFTEYSVQNSEQVSSAHEYADREAPATGGTQTFIGNVHGYDLQDSLTIFEGVGSTPVTMSAGEIIGGSVPLRIVRTSHTFHPDSLTVATNSYKVTYYLDNEGLNPVPEKTTLIPMHRTVAYIMCPVNGMKDAANPYDRAALSNFPETLAFTGVGDHQYGQSRSSHAVMWGSGGKISAAIYVPDIYSLTDGFTRGHPNQISVEDREGKLTKAYFSLINEGDTPQLVLPGEVETRSARYVISYHAVGADSVLAPGGGSPASILSSAVVMTEEGEDGEIPILNGDGTATPGVFPEQGRSSLVATMRRMDAAFAVGFASGNAFGTYAVCQKTGTYKKIRLFSAAAGGTAPTALVAAVWDSTGAHQLARTADFHAEYAQSKKFEPELEVPLELKAGQVVHIGLASVSVTNGALQFRGAAGAGPQNGVEPILARSAAGYAGGAPPESCGAPATGSLLLAELI